MWGADTELIITVRHPVPACISTYEKSTGLPEGERFAVRGNIEQWAERDNIVAGADPRALGEQGYFDVYLRYWEQYHVRLAVTGLAGARNRRVIAYGKERLTGCARAFFARFGGAFDVEEFHVSDNRRRHPEWMGRAQAAVERVATLWDGLGLAFPFDEVMEAW